MKSKKRKSGIFCPVCGNELPKFRWRSFLGNQKEAEVVCSRCDNLIYLTDRSGFEQEETYEIIFR